MKNSIAYLLILITLSVKSQVVSISVDVSQNRKAVSPYIYGKNNSLSGDPGNPLSADTIRTIKDAGIKLFRENHGNNGTKYNYRLKLESAPNWYNNVYPNDWDYAAKSLEQNFPGARGLWILPLINKVAA